MGAAGQGGKERGGWVMGRGGGRKRRWDGGGERERANERVFPFAGPWTVVATATGKRQSAESTTKQPRSRGAPRGELDLMREARTRGKRSAQTG